MLPALVVHLDALPLNPSGKVDRKALPEPDRGYVAPAAASKRFLSELWREVLGLEEVGARDNFFEIGATRRTPPRSAAGLR